MWTLTVKWSRMFVCSGVNHQPQSVSRGSSLPISFTHLFALSCPALIGDSHVMGWGSKAIEIRAVVNGQLDGVFMHKRTQKLRFLCERNDKVRQHDEVYYVGCVCENRV